MSKICVLGAGTMGAGIVQVFASKGHEVILRDIKTEYVEKGIAIIRKNLNKQVEKQKMTQEEADTILGRIQGTTELALAKDVDLVVEAAVENMDIKKSIFKELDALCKPETILATNTSSLSITEVATATARPDKVIGMHFFNPAYIMKLVELIKGIATSQETYDAVHAMTVAIDKEPVEVAEAPGFVVNRILVPMINEAIFVLSEGIASAKDIDNAMMLGANHKMGPLALSDFIGNDVVLKIMQVLHEETGDSKYRPCPLLLKYVRAGWLGNKSGKGFVFGQ